MAMPVQASGTRFHLWRNYKRQFQRAALVMRGLHYSTGEGRLRYQPPLDETEDAGNFCPHCYSSLDATRKPTILPTPWFDHDRRQVIVGDERRQLAGRTMFRLLEIFWERQDRLLSTNVLMDLLYATKMAAPDSKIISITRPWILSNSS
jgi:DNA-binding response OmpR family regulator